MPKQHKSCRTCQIKLVSLRQYMKTDRTKRITKRGEVNYGHGISNRHSRDYRKLVKQRMTAL